MRSEEEKRERMRRRKKGRQDDNSIMEGGQMVKIGKGKREILDWWIGKKRRERKSSRRTFETCKIKTETT